MKNILVIRPGAIGDALLTFPVLKALRELHDGTHITFVSNTQVLPLAQAWGIAEETRDFQDIQWSELFSSSGIRSSSMQNLLSQTGSVICWMRDPDGIIEQNLITSGVGHFVIAPGRPSAGEHLHIVDYLAQTIGLPTVRGRVDDVWLGGSLWSPVDGWNSQLATMHMHDTKASRFIAIHPGSGSVQKCWPIPRFAEVINRLWEQNHPVLLLTGPADSGRVNELLQQLSLPPAPDMLQILTCAPLLEVAQHLQQCRCYLGNDLGITHLAALLGIPTVAIFGPTDPAIWRPVGPFVTVLHKHTLEEVSTDAVIGCLDSVP